MWNTKNCSNPEIAKLLLLADADVNAKGYKYVACLCKYFKSCQLIFFSSSDETAMHYYAGSGCIEVCKLLLIAKADPNARSLT
jgi:hypothetical protein